MLIGIFFDLIVALASALSVPLFKEREPQELRLTTRFNRVRLENECKAYRLLLPRFPSCLEERHPSNRVYD